MSNTSNQQAQETTPNNPAYWAVLSAEVRYCKKIEMGAKLLYAELTALSNKEGYCWATNNYFAELYGVNVSTIKRWFASLQKHNFITIITEKKGCGWDRKIYIAQPNSKNVCEGSKMSPRGLKNEPSGAQKRAHNNTCNNTVYKTTTTQTDEQTEKVVVVNGDQDRPSESNAPPPEILNEAINQTIKYCKDEKVNLTKSQIILLFNKNNSEDIQKAMNLYRKQHIGKNKTQPAYPFKWLEKCLEEKWWE